MILKQHCIDGGLTIQLKDLSEGLMSNLQINAYPKCKNGDKKGETFCLTITNKALPTTSLKAFYQSLVAGDLKIEDLSPWYSKGKDDLYKLGLVKSIS